LFPSDFFNIVEIAHMDRWNQRARRAVALLLILAISGVGAFANVDPKKGRVTTNPTNGDSYSIEQEVSREGRSM
jgi:hypothetical protein